MSAATGSPLKVVECSTGVAGAYAGWLLKQMGAEVVRIGEAPVVADGADADADAVTLALAFYADGKGVIDAAEAAGAIAGAQLVITDDADRLAAMSGRSIVEIAASDPHVVVGVASIFGLTGPLAGVAATALDAQAEASVAWALGEQGRAPLSVPPGILECQLGAHLAAACLMARRAGPGDAGGRVVDVALNDVLASYVAVNCRFYIHHGMRWRRSGRRASDSGGAYPFVILPCKDGSVCLSGRARPEWERFVEAMGSPAWATEPRYQKLRAMGQQYPEEVDALIAPWLTERTKAEIEEIADRFRLTIAPLRDLVDVLATPQLADRGFLRDWTLGGRTLKGPGLPFRVADARGSSQGDDLAPELLAAVSGLRPSAGRKLLDGLRVVDLGWVWSAPQVGSILAQFGADVIKVEHRARPDNSRLAGVVIKNGERLPGQSADMSPMFHQINKGKRGITLNLKDEEGVDLLKRLVADSDIVLENMSSGSLERAGIGYDTLRAINPRLVMVSQSGAGQFGPSSDMRTYAPAMSSYAGLESLVGYAGELPAGALNFAVGDANAAVHALVALFAALERREVTGRGCYIDLSQTEALFATLTPYVLEAQIDGRQPLPMGNTHPTMAPHGIFPAAGEDHWLSLAVQDDRAWAALAGVTADQFWAREPRYREVAGRLADREALEAALAGWTATQERDQLVEALREAGVAASPVNDIEAFFADPQLAARGMIDPVELPGMGGEILLRAPWNVSDGEVTMGTRGPVVGEDNERVLCGTLELSASEFARLVEKGAIS